MKVDHKRYMKKISELTDEADEKFTKREHGGVITMDYYHAVKDVVKEYEDEKERVRFQKARRGVDEDS